MSVAGGEKAMRRREAWILLDREEQLRHGIIEAPSVSEGTTSRCGRGD
jgi:hypothetical protein